MTSQHPTGSPLETFAIVTSRTQATNHANLLSTAAQTVVVGKGQQGDFYPKLRTRLSPARVIIDRETGRDVSATPSDPFDVRNEGLVPETLNERLADQMHPRVGNDVLLVPVRYLEAQDSESLHAIYQAVSEMDMGNKILRLPIDRNWLTGGLLRKLIAFATRLDCSIALLPGGERRDPLQTQSSLRGVRELAIECPKVALWNTDLAGMWSKANGAPGLGMGTGTDLRHNLQPGQSGDSINPSDSRPSVLDESLHRFLSGAMLDRIGAERICEHCCAFRSLSSLDSREVYRHNIITARRIYDDLLANPRQKFLDRLTEAAVEHERMRIRPQPQQANLFKILEIPIHLDR